MKRFVPLLCAAMVLGMFSGMFFPAGAEDSAFQATNIQDALPKLNRIKPLQNPKFAKADSALGRSVLDRSNRIVGRVDDVRVAPDGSVQALAVTFDRLRLDQSVDIRYGSTTLTPSSNGYKIGLSGDEVTSQYPELLSGIETASGDGSIPGVKGMIGLDVYNSDGSDQIGEITDVIMNEERTVLEAVYVTVNQGTVRDEGVAVPFTAFQFADENGISTARLDDADIEALMRFVETD